ncbi:MAG: CbtA family protein [Rhodopila sp.]
MRSWRTGVSWPSHCRSTFRRSPFSAALGILLIMMPHLVGAPRLDHVETAVPDSLSHQFIIAVTLMALPCWALLGALTGCFYQKFSGAAKGRQASAAELALGPEIHNI